MKSRCYLFGAAYSHLQSQKCYKYCSRSRTSEKLPLFSRTGILLLWTNMLPTYVLLATPGRSLLLLLSTLHTEREPNRWAAQNFEDFERRVISNVLKKPTHRDQGQQQPQQQRPKTDRKKTPTGHLRVQALLRKRGIPAVIELPTLRNPPAQGVPIRGVPVSASVPWAPTCVGSIPCSFCGTFLGLASLGVSGYRICHRFSVMKYRRTGGGGGSARTWLRFTSHGKRYGYIAHGCGTPRVVLDRGAGCDFVLLLPV